MEHKLRSIRMTRIVVQTGRAEYRYQVLVVVETQEATQEEAKEASQH